MDEVIRRGLPLVVAAAVAGLLGALDAMLAVRSLAHPLPWPEFAGLLATLSTRWILAGLVVALPCVAMTPGQVGRVSPCGAAIGGVATASAVAAVLHGAGDAWQPATGGTLTLAALACAAAGWAVALLARLLPGRRPGWALVLVAVLALGLAWARGPAARRSPATGAWVPAETAAPADAPDLVLLTIDTWRADTLAAADAPLTPQGIGLADRLTEAGVYFAAAVAPAPLTGPCHSTMLAGVPPWHSGVLNNGQPVPAGLPWLPSQLRAVGYTTAAFVSSAMLDGQLGFARGFEVYDDDLTGDAAFRRSLWGWVTHPRNRRELRQERFERPGGLTVDRAAAWLETVDPDRPVFLWVHLYEPHAPYEPPDTARQRFAGTEPALADPASYADHPAQAPDLPDPTAKAIELLGLRPPRRPGRPAAPERPTFGRPPGAGEETAKRAIASAQAYLAEVSAANDIGEQLSDQFERARVDRPAIWLVAGDHGESLTEHNELRSHKQHVYDANVRVPLLVAGADLDPARVEEPLSTAGVAGTLASLAGIADPPFPCLPGPLPCASAVREVPVASIVRGPDHDARPARVLKASVRDNGLKLVRSHAGPSGWSEWYALTDDPDEITPLDPLDIDPLTATTLTTAADLILDAASDRRSTQAVPDEVKEALRALGYVE